MNWLSFKRWVFILTLCMVGTDGFSNTINEGTERYKKRIDNYRDMWESLMPTYTKLQYAGGMGLMQHGTIRGTTQSCHTTASVCHITI